METGIWKCKHFRIKKYNSEQDYQLGEEPESVETIENNLITNNGLKVLWRCITGEATGVISGTGGWFPYTKTNMYIGVGDNGGSSVSPLATVNDVKLNASTNTAYAQIDQTKGIEYRDTEDAAGPMISIEASFTAAMANFSWNEWGLFNGNPSNLAGRTLPASTTSVPGVDYNLVMLNHKTEGMGSKVNGALWVCDVLFQLQNAGT